MKILIKATLIVTLVFSSLLLFSCGDSNVTVNEKLSTASDGLDLQAVGELAKKTNNAQEFETELNKEGGLNNLDLNEDGTVDYVNVTEFGTGDARGFSLTTTVDGETQELATIQFERENNSTAAMNIAGNQQVYGDNHYYHDSFNYSDAVLMMWLFNSSRPMYVSPYIGGGYPARPRTITRTEYVTRKSTLVPAPRSQPTTTSMAKTQLTSPNAGRSANNIKATLSKPTQSQAVFQSKNPSKSVTSTGFSKTSPGTSGKPSSGPSRPSSPPSRSSAPSRSSSGRH